jgi:enoyl-CoA hydratase/carnithine racemase
MSYEFVVYEKRDHIAYITINRPDVMNAFHPPTNEELSDIWDDFQRDRDAWVCVVTGAGDRAFCAGQDLKYDATHGVRPPKPGVRSLMNRYDLWKPVIAAVNGLAMGGGLELSLACDILIAAEHATFGLREPRVGYIALGGGVHRLPRQIPLKIAMGMLLTAKIIDAQEAYRIGLVNEVVALPDLMPTAERWAREIMECAPIAVRATKEGAMHGLTFPLEMAMKYQYTNVIRLVQSEDFKEGPKAFAEKRKPEWRGR